MIKVAAQAKRAPIPNFSAICRDKTDEDGVIEAELPINKAQAVQSYYSTTAYNLLSSVIVATQDSEDAFTKFLFDAHQRAEDDFNMWELLVDEQKQFNFEVQTNFNHIELRAIEAKLA